MPALALGLAAALRRWELVALERRDVEMVDNGLKLTLRHSKTDNEGQGQVIRMRKANGSAARDLARRDLPDVLDEVPRDEGAQHQLGLLGDVEDEPSHARRRVFRCSNAE